VAFYEDKKGVGCKEKGTEESMLQDPTVQAVQNLTKRIVRVVEKKWWF